MVDLTTGRPLYSAAADRPRLPASVEKLYTTSTALLRFGPNANLVTRILGSGTTDAHGGWHGSLYLRGGGDPTFGSSSYDNFAYGTGATMQRLVANLVRQAGITSVHGPIVGDESYFDSLRGTPPTGFQLSSEVEGLLSAPGLRPRPRRRAGHLVSDPSRAVRRPAAGRRPAQRLTCPSRVAPGSSAAPTPAGARLLATVHSPRMSTLIRLTNSPSDNFLAEMLLKDIGARFGGRGSTAAGAAVVRSQMAQSFGIHPRLEDGSGLSRNDLTSPREVVRLLSSLASELRVRPARCRWPGLSGTLQAGLRGHRTPRDAAAARPAPCTTWPTWSVCARPGTATSWPSRS